MITVKRTYDKEAIRAIVTNPDIWQCVAEDGSTFSDFDPDVNNECWLMMEIDGVKIAVYNLHAINSATVQIHAHVLQQYRKDYSKETGNLAIKYILDNTDYQKVVAFVPVIYENVKNFTQLFGFVVEGILTKSIKKNGILVDQWILAATRGQLYG